MARSKKRPAKKALVPQTFREVAEKALGLENPELSGDRVLANMTVEVERKRMQWASQGLDSTLTVAVNACSHRSSSLFESRGGVSSIENEH